MGGDRVEQLLVGQSRITKVQLRERRTLLAQEVAHGDAGARGELAHHGSARRGLQVLDDVSSIPALRIIARVLRDVPHSGLW